MIIQLKKFGVTLTSRDSGREAYAASQSSLKGLKQGENLILDFEGVNTFSPSWGDEFLTNLQKKHKDRLILRNTKNASVVATLELLSEVNKVKFNLG